MSAHGEAAEQVVDMATKATVKGVEVVANLTGKGLISLATFLMATLKEQKRTKGKTRIEAFRGKPTKVFVMRREDFSQFAAEAKKYGVLYAAIMSKKDKDGMVDVVVNANDAARVNRISERFAMSAEEVEKLRETILKAKEEKSQNTAHKERTDPTAEKDAHTVDDATLDEMMGNATPPQQTQHKQPVEISEDGPNPMKAGTAKSSPSAPLSEHNVGIEMDNSAEAPLSVKEQIRVIREERREKAEQGKSQPTHENYRGTTRRQPQRQKPTKAKER